MSSNGFPSGGGDHNLSQGDNNNNSSSAAQFANLLYAFQQQLQQQQQQPSSFLVPQQQQQPQQAAASMLEMPAAATLPEVVQFSQPTTTNQYNNSMTASSAYSQWGDGTLGTAATSTTDRRLSLAAGATTGSRAVGRGLTERQQFLVFIKILLKYVERTNNPQLRRTIKAVVTDCTRRNRNGETAFMPLQAAVERRLRIVLGEVHWSRARMCFDSYVERQGIHTVSVTDVPTNVTTIRAV